MSSRSIGMACFALAIVLFLLGLMTVLGGVGPSADTAAGVFYRASAFAAAILAVVAGAYMTRKAPTYY
jgi:hypothetical protein